MNVVINSFKKMLVKRFFLYSTIAVCFVGSMLFVQYNYSFYDRPIAKIIETNVVDSVQVVDMYNNRDQLFTQQIIAELKNGQGKGQQIHITNEYSTSGAYDHAYRVGNEVFVSYDDQTMESGDLTGSISDVKRDKYILMIMWVFIFVLLLIGKKQGFFSFVSLAVNALLLSFALDVYVNNSTISLLWICGITIILFTVTSLLLVNGFNEKAYAAIVATLLGTFISLLIAYLVIWFTAGNGLRYEEMSFLTRPYEMVFMAGLFIGSLGAVMDVAITMSSSIFGLYEKDNNISTKALTKSGLEIGKDIMGTMTNILFFAYISGSIPAIILFIKNHTLLSFALSMNLSLELARALAGGIGIVLAIPIGLYTSIFFVNRKRHKL